MIEEELLRAGRGFGTAARGVKAVSVGSALSAALANRLALGAAERVC